MWYGTNGVGSLCIYNNGLGTFGDRSYTPPPTVNYIKEEDTDNDEESVDTEEK